MLMVDVAVTRGCSSPRSVRREPLHPGRFSRARRARLPQTEESMVERATLLEPLDPENEERNDVGQGEQSDPAAATKSEWSISLKKEKMDVERDKVLHAREKNVYQRLRRSRAVFSPLLDPKEDRCEGEWQEHEAEKNVKYAHEGARRAPSRRKMTEVRQLAERELEDDEQNEHQTESLHRMLESVRAQTPMLIVRTR